MGAIDLLQPAVNAVRARLFKVDPGIKFDH